MTVVWAWQGAVTSTGFRVVTKVTTGADVRLAVADNEALTSPTFFGPVTPSAELVASVTATGLDPDTRYWWAVEHDSVLDATFPGQLLTDPTPGTPVSYVVGAAGDAGLTPEFPGIGTVLAADRLSNHPVFDTIATRAVAENWRRFLHLGDLDYYDLGSGSHGIVGGASLANYRRAYDDVLAQTRQHDLYRSVGTNIIWDDHDYGPDSSDGTHVGKAAAQQAYREVVPHYPLPGTAGAEGPLYHSFELGRVLFMVADVRSDRSPNSDPDDADKTMLGAAQKAWMASTLAGTDAEVLVWVLPSQWTTSTADSWASFQTERNELVTTTFAGWLDRMCVLGADSHSLYLITENFTRTSEPFLSSFFPHYHFASLDAEPSPGPQTDTGPNSPGRGQYGTIQVTDHGTHIIVTGTGYIGLAEWRSYSFAVNTPISTTIVTDPRIARAIAGSHTPLFEARVLSTFQTGVDPDGEEILVVGGSVTMDGTADVQRSLDLTTIGAGQFPRRTGDLLLPDGTEVFVRRGLDLGDQIIWAPLGYFRIQTAAQPDAPDGEIRLAGFDRMKGLVDSPLLSPVAFAAGRTFGEVFAELVGGVYPGAVIQFDDGTETEHIGRLLIVERSRYEPLRTLADSRGKILHWDGGGALQIRTAPDPDTIVWEAKAGRDGVLARAARSVTRDDVVNAVVVRSQGGDGQNPARAVAIDDGPHSITRFGGRFGVVPEFITVPATSTFTQLGQAARDILTRRAGLPHQVEFEAVPNPAVQPYDAIRITLRNGEREKHVLERLAMPLTARAAMTAATREQRNVRVVVRTL